MLLKYIKNVLFLTENNNNILIILKKKLILYLNINILIDNCFE